MMFPKQPREESAAYRDLADGQDCTMLVPGVCCHDPATTVLAHSNRLSDNKGKSMKSHDHLGVWACHTCHSWLDQGGSASKAEKESAFDRAQRRMLAALRRIYDNPLLKPRTREAARWGLERLAARMSGDQAMAGTA